MGWDGGEAGMGRGGEAGQEGEKGGRAGLLRQQGRVCCVLSFEKKARLLFFFITSKFGAQGFFTSLISLSYGIFTFFVLFFFTVYTEIVLNIAKKIYIVL